MSRRSFQRTTGILALLVFVWVLRSPINQAGGDPRGSLLVAQALLETGSIRLDPYLADAHLHPLVRHVQEHRVDYYFPLGTPMVAVPFVVLARAAGLDMAQAEDEARLHKWLAALSVALALLLVATLAADAIPQWPISLGGPATKVMAEEPSTLGTVTIAEVFILVLGLSLGTGLSSTLGTAFWSNNTAVLLNLMLLILVQRWVWPFSDRKPLVATEAPAASRALGPDPSAVPKLSTSQAFILGALATISCLSRPTGVILFLGILGLVIWKGNRRGALSLLTFPILAASAFAVFSLRAYNSLTPPYYHPARLSNSESLPQILYGNLLSPGRGFLVFSPLLLLILLGMWRLRKPLRREPLAWLAVYWATAHLIAISRFPHWWGGHSFGNRLYLEAMPAWLLLALLVWRAWRETSPLSARNSTLILASLLALFGVWVHAWQGLYNLHSVMWNGGEWGETLGDINIDDHHEYLFDWRYPQMLANRGMIEARYREHQLRTLPRYPIGETLGADADPRHFEDWYPLERLSNEEQVWRWSEGTSSIVFRLDMDDLSQASTKLQLVVVAGSLEAQAVEVSLNGKTLGRIEPEEHFTPVATGFIIEASLLAEANRIEIRAADARSPAGDDRIMGLAFHEMRLEGEDGSP